MKDPTCRFCSSADGEIVLDLGRQPACDHFPALSDPGPDDVYPLRMWLCAACGLAQLAEDATEAEEPKATEPEALVRQAADAVARVAGAGWLQAGRRVAEFGSPHGGSWLSLAAERGLEPVGAGEIADVVLDCFGLMHSADQAKAMAKRAARVAPGGVLLIQFHSVATIMAQGQWNALRHGHFAYYSTTALARMLSEVGFALRHAWHFDLYGGTVLLAATRDGTADETVDAVLTAEAERGVTDAAALGALQRAASDTAEGLHRWLVAAKADGRRVVGYGAASRAIALLCRAGVDVDLLPAVADASPAKHGLRMPGTAIPVISPDELLAAEPDSVLLFLPDLMAEVRTALPGIEAAGGQWLDVDHVTRERAR